MSKTIFGKCPRCPASAPARRLYGTGVCGYHLQHPEQDQSKEKEKAEPAVPSKKKLLALFFREQVKLVPRTCENCKGIIITTAEWPKSAAVAHIVPKNRFESVMVHPQNRWFGCINCHTNYDQKGWDFAVTMPVWPTCVERFKKFMDLISDKELRFLPDVLRDFTGR